MFSLIIINECENLKNNYGVIIKNFFFFEIFCAAEMKINCDLKLNQNHAMCVQFTALKDFFYILITPYLYL